MSLQAHTNRVGDYTKYETKRFSVLNLVTNKTTNTSYSVPVAESFKKKAIKGDGKTATPYQRTVNKLLVDQPTVTSWKSLREDGSIESGERITAPMWGQGSQLSIDWLDASDLVENAINGSNVKALNQLGGDKQQLLVDLLESKKTFQMLLNAATSTAKVLHHLKRGNVGAAAKEVLGDSADVASGKTAADMYLKWKYGWQPTLKSIYDYQELLKREPTQGLKLKGKGFMPITRSHVIDRGDSIETQNLSGGAKTVYTGTVDSELAHLASTAGMVNPLAAAWELVPFSFVVDWFVPVGDVLEAYSALTGLTDVKGYTSTWTDSIRTVERVDLGPDDYNEVMHQKGKLVEASYDFNRIVHETPLRPALYGEPNPFSGRRQSRGWSAAALIRQLLK